MGCIGGCQALCAHSTVCIALLCSLGTHDFPCFTLLSHHPWTRHLTNHINAHGIKSQKNYFHVQTKPGLLCCSFWNISNPLLHITARIIVSEINSKILLQSKKPRGWRNCLNLSRPLGGSAAPSQPWHPQGLWKQQPELEQPLTKFCSQGSKRWGTRSLGPPFFQSRDSVPEHPSISGKNYQNQHIMKS